MDTNKPTEQENPSPMLTTGSQSEIRADNSVNNDVIPDTIAPTHVDGSSLLQPGMDSVSATEVKELAETNIVVSEVNNTDYEEPSSSVLVTETAVILTTSVLQSTESPIGVKSLLPAIGNSSVIVPDEIIDFNQISASIPFPSSFTPCYSTKNAEYGPIDPFDCIRSQEHAAMFNYSAEEEAEGIKESYSRHGRLKPVFGILRIVDGKPMCAVIDGNLFVKFAIATGIKKVFVCFITVSDQDDITKIMAQLQFSNHNTYMALFLIIQKLWPLYYKGQGYRSDLDEKQFDEVKPYGDGKKKFNIYEKIGKEIGLSGNAVKFIRKIGMVTPIHFKQIETSRHSLYAAYAACKKEETGEESTVPKAKAPTFIKTTSNDKPEFSEPNSTAVVAPVGNPPVDNTLTPAATSVASTSDNDEYIIVRGVCEACGQETNIRILKSQIK